MITARYDLGKLPAPQATRLDDFQLWGTPGFADIWIEHLGGAERAARSVLAAYDARFASRLVATPSESATITADWLGGLSGDAHHPEHADRLGRRLALRTLIEHRARVGATMLADTVQALIVELGVTSRYRKRRLDTVVRTLDGLGAPAGAAISVAAQGFGVAASTVWERRRLARKAARMSHPADPWFAVAVGPERVAQALMDQPQSQQTRWDLLMLISGYDRRRLPLPTIVISAIDRILGVSGRTDLSLGGVVERAAFVAAARVEARSPSKVSVMALASSLGEKGFSKPGVEGLRLWRKMPLYQRAIKTLTPETPPTTSSASD